MGDGSVDTREREDPIQSNMIQPDLWTFLVAKLLQMVFTAPPMAQWSLYRWYLHGGRPYTRRGRVPPFPPHICRNTALHWCPSIHWAALLIHLSTPVTPLICFKTSFQPAGELAKGGKRASVNVHYIAVTLHPLLHSCYTHVRASILPYRCIVLHLCDICRCTNHGC